MLKVCNLASRHGKGPLVVTRTYAKKCSTEKKKPERPPPPPPPPVPEKVRKVAVILSGCGVLDGSEITESVAAAYHLDKYKNVEPRFYAPLCPQADVFDHVKQCPSKDSRCAMVEAARITRGKIKNVCELQHCDASAVIFPGGFGVSKTLSTFASDGVNFGINEDITRIIQDFHAVKKPMGFICISAILAARLIPCARITFGKRGKKWPHSSVIEAAMEMGAVVESKDVDGFSFDKQNLIFSTPAYMYDGTVAEVFDGIGHMIDQMYKIME